jgi:hypothetical protein
MVFSKDVEIKNQMGTAFIIPCKKEIKSFKGLFYQAQYLSEAEGSNDKKLVKGENDKWCTIGLLFNPNFNQLNKNDILIRWERKLIEDGIGNDYQNYRVGNKEYTILSSQGEILINWLKALDSRNQAIIDKFDIIIATCTKPSEPRYPDAVLIKENSIIDKRKYFFNNIRNGISTFQDRDVIIQK